MCLTSGFAVHAALVEALPEMPEEISRTLAAAEPLGQMERALARVLKRKRPGRQVEVEERASFYRFYPIGLTLMILLVATFLMLFVMPKVREIVKDYRIPTPWTTNVMLQVSSLLTEHAWILLVAALLALAIYWPMSLYLHRIILPGWRLPAVGGVLELVKWWIPGLRGIERDQSMAQTAEFLEEALRAGVPLTRALERSLLLPTNAYLRKRLRRWMDDLEAGQPAGEAARNAGLPELLAGLLAPGQDDAALADMFGFLARYYRQRFSRGLVLLRAALEPAVVILFGVLVFGVALSVLQPIIAIMQHEMSFYPGYL